MYANESEGSMFPPQKSLDCMGMPALWDSVFDIDLMYPEYLSDLDVLLCPSSPAKSTALDEWDRGPAISPKWQEFSGMMATLGQTGNGIVEPCEVYGVPYMYLGWVVDDETAAVWLEDISDPLGQNMMALDMAWELDPGVVNDDWVVAATAPGTGTGGGDSILRFREGIERFMITDINNPAGSAQAQTNLVVMWDSIMGMARHFNHVPGGANVLYMDGHVSFMKYYEGNDYFPMNELGIRFGRSMHMHTGGMSMP